MTSQHFDFILNLINDEQYISINLIDFTNRLFDKFKLNKSWISPYNVYRLSKENKIVFKKSFGKNLKIMENEQKLKKRACKSNAKGTYKWFMGQFIWMKVHSICKLGAILHGGKRERWFTLLDLQNR